MRIEELTLHAALWPAVITACFTALGFFLAVAKWRSEDKADEARRKEADEKDERRRECAVISVGKITEGLNQANAALQRVTERLNSAEEISTAQQKLIDQLQQDRMDHSTRLTLAEAELGTLRRNGGDQDATIIELEDTVKELKNEIDALRRRLDSPRGRAPRGLGQASAARSRIPVRVRQNSAAGGAPAGQRGRRPGQS